MIRRAIMAAAAALATAACGGIDEAETDLVLCRFPMVSCSDPAAPCPPSEPVCCVTRPRPEGR